MNKRKKVGRKRKFNRIALFPHKPISENVEARRSLEKAFPCRFCQMSYLDTMIEELTRLINLKESKVAIVDTSGVDMKEFHNIMTLLQGNRHGFNS